jgi:hypothetical protein
MIAVLVGYVFFGISLEEILDEPTAYIHDVYS